MITFQIFLAIIIITMYLIGLIYCYVGYKKAKFWYDKDEMHAARLGFIILLIGFLIFICLIIFSPIIKYTITVLITAVGSLIAAVKLVEIAYFVNCKFNKIVEERVEERIKEILRKKKGVK